MIVYIYICESRYICKFVSMYICLDIYVSMYVSAFA